MSYYCEQAIERLDRERKEATGLGRAANVMAKPVAEQLKYFCRQDEEFAQAVVEGGSFKDCMAAIENGCGTALSDYDAYKRAVRFYFPGAEISMSLTIDLIGAAADRPTTGLVLDLADFLV